MPRTKDSFVQWNQRQHVFPCPVCRQLLSSKRSNKNAPNAIEHFKNLHPRYPPETYCLSCLLKNPSPEHRAECCSGGKSKSDSQRVVRKRETALIPPPAEFDRDEFDEGGDDVPPGIEENDARVIRNYAPLTPRFVPTPQPLHLAAYEAVPKLEPSLKTPFLLKPGFRAYVGRRFEDADPRSAAGKAVRLLLSYRPDEFYHLIVCYVHLRRFDELCSTNPTTVQITEFSCFCNSSEPLKDKTVNKVLHLHLLAHVPDWKAFSSAVWNRLLVRTGGDGPYKRAVRINSLYHLFHCICYVSQKKHCSKHGAHDHGKKHFLLRTPLPRNDRIELELAVPNVALRRAAFYGRIQHLRHYDVYYFDDKRSYRSRLSDVLGQLVVFTGRRFEGDRSLPGIDVYNDRAFEANPPFSVYEFMMKTFGSDTFVVWTNEAVVNHCKALFHERVMEHVEGRPTRHFGLKTTEEGKTILYNPEMEIGSNDVRTVLAFLRQCAEERKENLAVVGTNEDLKRFKSLANGREKGQDLIILRYQNDVMHVKYRSVEFSEDAKTAYRRLLDRE